MARPPIVWRDGGRGMATIDLTRLEGEQVVIHFGGALTSVDAYTFANSLVGLADTARSINALLNPGRNIEVRIEALGPGSFRAVIKRISKGVGGFFSRNAEKAFWAILTGVIVLQFDGPDVQIVVEDDQVVVHQNGDRIIIPRDLYDTIRNVAADEPVQKGIKKTFQVIEGDDAIENFGLTPKIDDKEPLVQVPRKQFAILSSLPEIVRDDERRRERTERVRLLVIKSWLRRGARKWQFEWNGVPISAPIYDDLFWEKVERREYLIGHGDVLEVMLTYKQDWDPAHGIYINDPTTFAVAEVLSLPRQQTQLGLPE